jgi:hypothetical protein
MQGEGAPDANGRKEALDREMDNRKSHTIYELMPRAPSAQYAQSALPPLMYKNGIFEKNKARRVAWGNCQCAGVDFGESFSPVMCLESRRTFIALPAIHNLDVIQFDID